jgi:MFS family permease
VFEKLFPTDARVRQAYTLIVILGIVALCGDVIYEGARSVSGQYILILGGSAALVGFIAGFGEFAGYALRLVTGYFADRSRHYWIFLFIGYGLLAAVPLLAFAGNYEIAALFLILERVGKGIRSPAKDAILSHATSAVGRGWGFGIHEFFDQIGAVAGPLIFTAAFLFNGGYREGFALLAIPFLLLLAILFLAWRKAPDTTLMETGAGTTAAQPETFPAVFVPYSLFTLLTMLGFIAFPLIAFHFKAESIAGDAMIPLLYAVAMGVDAVVALAIGRAYDRSGLITLAVIPFINLAIPVFAYLSFFTSDGLFAAALVSAVLWGAAMGIQETVLRAAIADFTSIKKRGFAYGIFNTVYGLGWFAGSVVIGLLYEISIPYIITYVAVLQLLALPAFVLVLRRARTAAKV